MNNVKIIWFCHIKIENFMYIFLYLSISNSFKIINNWFVNKKCNLFINNYYINIILCAVVDFEHIERQYDTSDEDFELLGWRTPNPSSIPTRCEITIKYYTIVFLKTICIFN